MGAGWVVSYSICSFMIWNSIFTWYVLGTVKTGPQTLLLCVTKSRLVCWFVDNRIISFSCESEVYTAYHGEKRLRSIQPGSSECQSDAYTLTNWATGALTLEQRIGGNIHGHSLILKVLVVGFTLHANRQPVSKCISLPTMYEKVISHWPCEL